MKKKRILIGLGAFALAGLALTSCGGEKSFTVTFYDGTTALSTQTVTNGYNAEVPTAPTSTGKIFNGWYADEALTTAFDFGSIISGDTPVYASWINECTVTFKDVSKTLSTQTVTPGYNAKVPTAPTKEGQNFNGWYADAALTTPYNFGSVVKANTSVYARFDVNYISVNLYLNADTLFETIAVPEGETLPDDLAPTMKYKEFSGVWYTDAACTQAYDASSAVTSELTLYAGWEEQTESVEYKFLASDFESVGTVGDEGWSYGCFSASSGTIFRTESGKKYNGQEYKHGLKLEGADSYFAIDTNGTGKVTVIMADRGSLTSVKLKAPSDTEGRTISLDVESKMTVLTFDVEEAGKYMISLGSGTPDIVYAMYKADVAVAAPDKLSVSGQTTEFIAGTKFDASNLKVELNYKNGRVDAVDSKDVTIDSSAFDTTKPGTYTIKVKYSITDDYATYNLEKTYDVNVLALSDMELGYNEMTKSSTNTSYGNGQYINTTVAQVLKKGATLDLSALTIKALTENEDFYQLYKNGINFGVDGSTLTVSDVDTSTTGVKTVTVTLTLNGVTETETFNVAVVDTAPVERSGAIQLFVNPEYEGVPGTVEDLGGGITCNEFKTIQEALDYLSIQSNIDSKAKVIQLAPGTYEEKLDINIPNLTIKGASDLSSSDEYVILWDSCYGLEDESGFEHVTDSTQTVAVRESAVNCTISGITIANKYHTIDAYAGTKYEGSGERALALLVQSDKFVMENGRLLGWQDTLQTFTGRQYFKNCFIQGCVDYIFGTNSATYFDECEIHTVKSKTSAKDGSAAAYVTAYKGINKDNEKGSDAVEYGAVFNECNFTVEDGFVGYVCVGRNWGNYTSVTVINSSFSNKFATKASEAINGSLSAKNNVTTLKYRFYGNVMDGAAFAFEEDIKDADGNVINHAITAEAAAKINELFVFAPTNGKVSFDDAWGGQLEKDATIVLKDAEGNTLETLTNVTYVGSYFTQAQFKDLYKPEEGKLVKGLYTDAACTTAFDYTKTLADSTTTLYVKFETAKHLEACYVTSSDLGTISTTADTQWGTTAPLYLAHTSKAWTKDENSKTITLFDGTTFKSTYRVKSEGANTMYLDLTKYAGTYAVTVYAQTGSSSDLTRKITVTADGSTTALYTSTCDKNEVLAFTYILEGGAKYNFVTSSAINFYAVSFENVLSDATRVFRTDTTTGNEVKSFGKDSSDADITQIQGTTAYVDDMLIDATGYYTAAEGLTAWAANTNYYTEKDGVYTKVDQTTVTAPVDGTTYYTLTKGKLSVRAQQWAQINKGTSIKFRVKAGSYVTVSAYSTDFTYQIGTATAVAFTNKTTTFKVTTDTYVTIAATANTYIDSISVAAPGVISKDASYVLGNNNADLATAVGDSKTVQGAILKYEELLINASASGAKFYINGGDNVQFNTGTTIQFYVNKGATVKVTGYSGSFAYSINDIIATEAISTFTATEDNTLVTITGTDNKYLKAIDVTYPQVFQPITVNSTNWTCEAGKDNQTIFSNDLINISTTKFAAIESCGANCTEGASTGGKMNNGKTISFENKSDKTLYFTIKVVGNGDNKTLVNTADAEDIITMNSKAYVLKTITVAAGKKVTYNSTGGVYFVSCVVTDTITN